MKRPIVSSLVGIFLASLANAIFAFSAVAVELIVRNEKVPGLKNGMDYVKLGDYDLVVSKVCMGTMTYGQQNTIEELLNCAFDKYGVNFLDTAEIYPVPTKAETQGQTDAAVKQFLQGRGRSKVIVATKVAGRSGITWLPWKQERGSFIHQPDHYHKYASLKTVCLGIGLSSSASI